MKYPQLVSTRAVNAISDWLVSRLEQIGVEAPLIYSRLLLSLLHSSVQINDPIEFSNLETYFANQKGTKRIPLCDTETIKKFTAVQCLLDAVSTEQEISNIENLVDELFVKLNDLEKQTVNEENLHRQLPTALNSLDIEDPRKRYYRAFPALSKEMEKTVWLPKNNEKSLTWPSGNLGTSSSNMVALNNTAGVKRKNKRRRNQAMNKGRVNNVRKNSYSGGTSSPNCWDTDFEGNWEMGTDLIKEFLMSQKNRNRSISESDACNMHYQKNAEKRMKPTTAKLHAGGVKENRENEIIIEAAKNFTGQFENNRKAVVAKQQLQQQLKNTESYMDEYVPCNDLISFKDFDYVSNINHRQMYQHEDDYEKPLSVASQQQRDFAQFEAKFNSDVEALWKDDKKGPGAGAVAEIVAAAPADITEANNPKNLENFWTNYYNHHYNNKSDNSEEARPLLNVEPNNNFLSLPSTFGTSLNNHLRNGEISVIGEKLSSVVGSGGGVFLQNSIWSDQKTFDENNSFYGNCWKSVKDERGDSFEAKDLPNPFSISKWSECSFETPFISSSSVASNASGTMGMTTAGTGTGAVVTVNREQSKNSSYVFNNYKHPVAANNVARLAASGSNNSSSSSSNSTNNSSNILHQHQLSQPASLPDFYGSLRFSEKDFHKLPSNVPLVPQTTPTCTVSLTNHSKTSGFVEYSIVKSSFVRFEPTVKYDRNNSARNAVPSSASMDGTGNGSGCGGAAASGGGGGSSASSSSALDDDDNLLTSYRTHFRPIKQNYADGYQFDISGNLDEIEFERSESGCLYFESEKYFEYTRFDTFLSDEDSSSSSAAAAAAAASSSSTTTTAFGAIGAIHHGEKQSRGLIATTTIRKGLYPLKFRMKQMDKQCQTEDLIQTPVSGCDRAVIVAKRRNMTPTTSRIIDEQHDCSTDSDFNEETSFNLDQWTMAEIRKKCSNNNSHTLWGMCPACAKENKCIPANRLLKDELLIEADEIMSDLKYMQDLYICSDWENEDDENDTDSELEALKNDEDDCEEYGNDDSIDDDDDEQEQIFYNITKLISDLLKPENAKSLANVLGDAAKQGKNIFGGIYSDEEYSNRPGSDGGAVFDYQKNMIWKSVGSSSGNNNNNNNNNNEKYIGGLWSNDDENMIWKRELKPWNANNNNWSRLSDSNNTTAAFLEKLNWKHTNLASIWKTSETKSPSVVEQSTITSPICIKSDTIMSSQHIDLKSTNAATFRNLKNVLAWNLAKNSIDRSTIQNHSHQTNCIATQTGNANGTAGGASNRTDRKRRHSASQNISCNGNCSGTENGSLSAEWYDSNGMLRKIGNKMDMMTKRELDYNRLTSILDGDCTSQKTIITCKYWTTMDTTLASPYFMDKSSNYDGIGAMALNPSSILRHVAVVSRPLTR